MDKKKELSKQLRIQQNFQIATFNATAEVVKPTKTVVMAKNLEQKKLLESRAFALLTLKNEYSNAEIYP